MRAERFRAKIKFFSGEMLKTRKKTFDWLRLNFGNVCRNFLAQVKKINKKCDEQINTRKSKTWSLKHFYRFRIRPKDWPVNKAFNISRPCFLNICFFLNKLTVGSAVNSEAFQRARARWSKPNPGFYPPDRTSSVPPLETYTHNDLKR